MSEKIVQLNEEIIKGQIKELVRGSVEETLNELLEKEAEQLTQAARYERNEARQGYRSGHYDRNLTTTSGDVTLHMPRLKGVSFETAIIERYRRRESSVEEALIEMYLAGADIFPQGFAAVAEKLHAFDGTNLLCDIGNGTMSVLQINNRKPVPNKSFTEKYGTNQCVLAIREALMRKFNVAVDDSVIESVLRFGSADIAEKYLTVIREIATAYVAGIFRKLREHEYHPDLMKLYVVGGGGCLIKNFGDYDKKRVTINDNICATARGYEYLARNKLQHSGDMV